MPRLLWLRLQVTRSIILRPMYWTVLPIIPATTIMNERVEELTRQLRGEFDPAARSRLAVQISQQLLDDNAFIYASHLKMSFVMKSNIKGFTAHPSDYYEITSDLEV